MKRNRKLLLLVLVLTLSVILMNAGTVLAQVYPAIDGGYVGTEACLDCHKASGSASDKTGFKQAGHPYKIRSTKGLFPVLSGGDNVTTITDPLSSILPMPSGSWINTLTLGDGCYDPVTNPTSLFKCNSGLLDWTSVQYVIGGFHTKARWGLKDDTSISGHNCGSPTGTNCKTGYVITGNATSGDGAGLQYNMHTSLPGNPMEDWSDYNNNQDKGYDCAVCHNTNGTSYNNVYCSSTGSLGYRSQPWNNMGWSSVDPATLTNKGGWKSEWTFDGVQCEACHGSGNTHANASGSMNVLAIDSSTATALLTSSVTATPYSNYQTALSDKIEICAKCHIRGSNTVGGKEWGCGNNNATLINGAAGSGNWIQHHEQYNEMTGVNTADSNPAHGDGVHASLNCTSCHDPHKRAHQVTDGIASALGITDNALAAQKRGAIVSCESCHGEKRLRYSMGTITCVDCHMGEATKSAPANGEVGTWGKRADVKTHIFKIDTAATSIMRAANTITDINGSLIPVAVAKNALSVDYSCGKCHDSAMTTFTGRTALDRATAQSMASNIHMSEPVPTFSWMKDTITSYQVHFDASRTYCVSGNCSYTWDFFGNATATGTGVSTSYTYANADSVTVILKVTDNTLKTSAATSQTVTPFFVNTAPVASKSALLISGMSVSFTDTSADGEDVTSALSVSVNWGDGNISTGNGGGTFSHTYAAAGSYTIRHSATDTGNLSSSSPNVTATIVESYGITGSVSDASTAPVPGVTMSLKMGYTLKKTTTTASDGSYSFTKMLKGCYTVIPSKAGVTFSPASQSVCVGPTKTNINFTAQ